MNIATIVGTRDNTVTLKDTWNNSTRKQSRGRRDLFDLSCFVFLISFLLQWIPSQNPDWFLRQSNYIIYLKRPRKPDIKGGRLWEIPLYLDSLIGLFQHFCVGEHFILKNKLTTEENVSKQASKTFKFIHVGVPPCKDRKLHKGLYGR